jgi:hypothetical protein
VAKKKSFAGKWLKRIMPAHFTSVLIAWFIWQQEKTRFSVKIRSVQFLNIDKTKDSRDMNAGFRQHIQNPLVQVEKRSDDMHPPVDLASGCQEINFLERSERKILSKKTTSFPCLPSINVGGRR